MSKKVTISKIKEFAKSKEKDFSTLGIEIKKYLPIKIKKAIIDLIVENAINDNKANYLIKQYSYEVTILREYSNIDLSTIDKIADETQQSDKMLELYDTLKELGIIDYIIGNIPVSEIEFIKRTIDSQIEHNVKQKESLEDIIRKFLNELMAKIPDKEGMLDLLNTVSNEFKGFDPEKLGIAKEMLMGLGQENEAKFVGEAKENIEKVAEVVKDELKEKKEKKKKKTN
jgi:hypothetical protein